jgi:hypothetical protein
MRLIFCTIAVLYIPILAHTQPFQTSYHARPMAKKNMDIGRTFDPASSTTINDNTKVPKPKIISKAEWGGKESSGTMRNQFPHVLTVHHAGSPKPLLAGEDTHKMVRNLQAYGWKEKNWPDIPYHFVVDRDGNIFEARDPLKVGDTNTAYDPAGKLLVMAMGNTDVQAPSEKQLDAMCDLMAWASDYYNIPPDTVRGHMEYTSTGCPGRYLYPYVVSGFFEGEVRKRLSEAYGKKKE